MVQCFDNKVVVDTTSLILIKVTKEKEVTGKKNDERIHEALKQQHVIL